MQISLLTWNVHKCRGTDGLRDPKRVLSKIAEHAPDVAVLQEADLKFGSKRGLFLPEVVAEATGLKLHPSVDLSNGSVGWRGNALLLREGIACISTKTMRLPSFEPRGAVVWSLEASGRPFEVIGMHLGLVGPWRRRQAASIAAEIASRKPVPTIVAGDSNDWLPGSRIMEPIEDVLGTAGEFMKTFPARWPLLCLDRVLAGRGAEIRSQRTADASRASDHLPVVTVIELQN